MASAPRLTEGTHVLNSDNFAIYPGSHLIRFSRSLRGRGASITASNLQRQYARQRGRLGGCLDSQQLTPLAAALQVQGLGSVWELGYEQSRGWRQEFFMGPFYPASRLLQFTATPPLATAAGSALGRVAGITEHTSITDDGEPEPNIIAAFFEKLGKLLSPIFQVTDAG